MLAHKHCNLHYIKVINSDSAGIKLAINIDSAGIKLAINSDDTNIEQAINSGNVQALN